MTSNHAAKIKALLSKTIENGATEDEAIAAAMKARELMDKYDIDLTTLDMKAEGFETLINQYFAVSPEHRAATAIAVAVAAYTDTKVYGTNNRSAIAYFGLKSDVAFATWLETTLVGFVVRNAEVYIKEWKAQQFVPNSGATKTERLSFIMGCSARIAKRLRDEADKRRESKGTGSMALVVRDKAQVVTEEWAKLNMKLGKAAGQKVRLSNSGWDSGARTGDEARWDKPVNTDQQRRLT